MLVLIPQMVSKFSVTSTLTSRVLTVSSLVSGTPQSAAVLAPPPLAVVYNRGSLDSSNNFKSYLVIGNLSMYVSN
jgi:hypothetical protein